MNSHRVPFVALALATLGLADRPVGAAPAADATPTSATRPKLGVKRAVAQRAEVSAEQRLAQLRSLIDPKATEGQLEEPVRLGVRKPWIDEHTFAYFEDADVDPGQNVADVRASSFFSYVGIKFRSAADRKYLVECTIDPIDHARVDILAIAAVPGATTYKVLVDAQVTVVDHSIFFALKPKGIRDVEFAFFGVDGRYGFHSCRINPVKPSK